MFHFLNFYHKCEILRIFEEIIPIKCYEKCVVFKLFSIFIDFLHTLKPQFYSWNFEFAI